MTKYKMICLLLLIAIWASNASAGEITEIRLLDGSIIYGEVVTLNDGIYTIRTESLGTLDIEGSQVQMIRMKPERSALGGPSGLDRHLTESEIKALQKSMNINDEVMDLILALRNDPEIQKILKDPEIMNALIKRDAAALLSNPKVLNLLNNPKIQAIQEKTTDQSTNQPTNQ